VDSRKFPEFIEELKSKNDIVSVISKYMTLERKGRSYWGRCPFHGEKTPSFVVNEYNQFYHCFGCGVGGDVIKFVQEIESIDFMGAIHILADFAHMEVPSLSGSSPEDSQIKQRKEEKDRLLLLMKETALHYVNNLKLQQARPALEYFEKRKISPQMARMFGLGYSLDYSTLIDHLKSKGFSKDEMLKAGVAKVNSRGECYDAEAGRVIFPIMDASSNVIAFGGRSLEPKPDFAKYLNTAETVLFNKSKQLYAINIVKKAKMNSSKLTSLIVVEGYMDVISLHKAGFTNAVASMGTALTNEQAKLIKRFVDKVYICYDGDTAGKKATLRGLDILKECGLDVYVMSMPEGLDPDDVINKYGAEGYQQLMEKALPLIDFKLEFLAKIYEVNTSEGKTKFLNEAIEVLKSLSEIEREVYVKKVSDLCGIMKDFIKRQIENTSGKQTEGQGKSNIIADITKTDNKIEQRQRQVADDKTIQAEKFVLSAMLHKKPYAFFKTDVSDLFTGNRVEYYKTIMELTNLDNENEMSKAFYDKFNSVDDNINNENQHGASQVDEITEIINYIYKHSANDNDMSYYKDCVYIIYKNYAEKEIEKLTKQIECEPDKEIRKQKLSKVMALTANIKNKKVDL